MKQLEISDIKDFVNKNIVSFHQNRLKRLDELNLNKLLEKNPYLYKAKNLESAGSLVSGFLDAFLSSSEEKMFGDFLESLAIFITSKTRNGHKASATGLDLEFVEGQSHYLISIKSGSNWGNNAQHKKLVDDFNLAERIIKQRNSQTNVIKILGICYGKTKTSYLKRGYFKLVGQNFWTFISGNINLYKEIIEPIGYKAKEHNDQFLIEKNKIINRMTGEFISRFCIENGEINWVQLIEHNSGNFDLNEFDF